MEDTEHRLTAVEKRAKSRQKSTSLPPSRGNAGMPSWTKSCWASWRRWWRMHWRSWGCHEEVTAKRTDTNINERSK